MGRHDVNDLWPYICIFVIVLQRVASLNGIENNLDTSDITSHFILGMLLQRRASTEWLIVSPIDSMSEFYLRPCHQGIDYFENDDIPSTTTSCEKITSSYLKGVNVDTIIRVSSHDKSG
jgi:hypothetical protein